MDLEELRTAREQERRTDSLQHLRDDFYEQAVEYVRELKRERSRRADAAGDPYSPEALRLTDEIDAAQETVESLYERRRGKLVKMASFAAASNSVETDGLTDQERELFDDLVDRIKQNERQVLDMSVGSDRASGAPIADSEPAVGVSESTAEAEPTAGGGRPAAEAEEPAPGEGRGPAALVGTPEPGDTATAGEGSESPDDSSGGTLADAMGTDTAGDESVGATSADASAGPNDTPGTDPAGGTTVGADAGVGQPTSNEPTPGGVEESAPSGPAGGSTEPDRPSAEAAAIAGDGPAGVSDAGSESARSTATDDDPETLEARDTDGGTVERETVRVTREVGEVLGVDNTRYTLTPGDTVFLPTANVEPLVEKDAVERL